MTPLCQVVRDFKGAEWRPGTTATNQKQGDLRKRIASFMAEQKAPVAAGQPPPRVSNDICVRALDHALQGGLGVKLLHFKAKRISTPLGQQEICFWTAAAHLPEGACARGETRRSCIVDTATRHSRFELAHSPGPLISLHHRANRGGVGWVMLFWLYTQYGLMGHFAWDEPHKEWGDVRSALGIAACACSTCC